MNLREEFRSWQEYIAASRRPTDMDPDQRMSQKERVGFNGCTLAQARTMASEGWLQGAERARKISAGITDALGALIERHDIYYDVEGDILDVGRFVSSEPECWAKFETMKVESISPKFVRVVINTSVSAAVSTDTIEGRGAVAAALVELLSFAGCSVELVLAVAMTGSGSKHTTLVTIKRFDEPLDMPLVAYALAHPSSLRVQWFSFMETQTAAIRRMFSVGSGYGMPATLDEADQGDVYLDRMLYGESQWTSAARATAWVRARLAEQGVKFVDEAGERSRT
jgi:hypothetical protein